MKISFRKNFTWNFFGNVLYAATQWGILIAITRLGSIEMVGIYSLALALTAPLIMFTNLDLRTVQATETSNKLLFSDFFSVRLISNIIFVVVLVSILIIENYKSFYVLAILLIAIAKIIESWSDTTYGHFQRLERMDIIAKSQIIRGVTSLSIMTITLLLTKDLVLSLVLNAISWLVIFLFYDFKKLRETDKLMLNWSPKLLEIFKLSLPLGIVALIVSLNSNIPRLLIEKFFNVEMLGYFTTIFYFVMVGEKFVRSLSQAALPRLSKLLYEQNRIKYLSILTKILLINLFIGLIGLVISIVFGEQILILIYGSQYQDYGSLLVIIMTYGLINYLNSTLLVGVNSLRLFSVQKYLSIFWLLVMILLCVPLIGNYGLVGAGLSLVFYSLVRFITISVLLIYGLKAKFN